MPGFILHLTTAQMLLEMAPDSSPLNANPAVKNAFRIGCFLPDISADKSINHFRNPEKNKDFMQIPDLSRFLFKYGSRLSDPVVLGCYFHLYVDKRFFVEYLPNVVTFLNSSGQVDTLSENVTHAYIKKSDIVVPIKDYRSQKYYYGDYTRLNTYLMHRFHFDTKFNYDIDDPGIDGINMKDLIPFVDHLNQYLSVPEEAAANLTVFDTERLLGFLNQVTRDFFSLGFVQALK